MQAADPNSIINLINAEPLLNSYSAEAKSSLAGIAEHLIDAQERMNLTAIRKPELIVRYHLADSIALDKCYEQEGWKRPKLAADIGTGGGFPLLPLAVIWPATQWVGIESVAKKARYVEETAVALGLKNAECLPMRAEDFGREDGWEEFDLVTSRAVGPISGLLEVSLPLLKVGGIAALYKTSAAHEEWEACQDFLKNLGGAALPGFSYELEGDQQQRGIYLVKKNRATPSQYPRINGMPFRKPIVPWDKGNR